jgi:hypothetical protein
MTVEQTAAAIDGGIGAAAIAAIAALPPGPRQDLEAVTWAQRILAGRAQLAFVLPAGVAADTAIGAFEQLHGAILREASRIRKGGRR